jgi:3-hydroxybutyryl-CoA dehydratase
MSSVLYFDDLSVGQKWTSSRRTVTESDVVIFAGMTGDFDRAHVDHDYASKSRFKQPLMHGLMGLAWAAGLSTTAPAVRTLALVSVEQWKFLRPVHIGDTVYAVTEVLELSSGGRSAGKVTWKKTLLTIDGDEVQSGQFVSYVELAPRAARGKIPEPHVAIGTATAGTPPPSLVHQTSATTPNIVAPNIVAPNIVARDVVGSSVEWVQPNLNGSESKWIEAPPVRELSSVVVDPAGSKLQADAWTIVTDDLPRLTAQREFRAEPNSEEE